MISGFYDSTIFQINARNKQILIIYFSKNKKIPKLCVLSKIPHRFFVRFEGPSHARQIFMLFSECVVIESNLFPIKKFIQLEAHSLNQQFELSLRHFAISPNSPL